MLTLFKASSEKETRKPKLLLHDAQVKAIAYLIPSRLICFNLIKNSFAIKVVEAWNRLTDRAKLTEKTKSFKKELKKIITWTQKERMEKRKGSYKNNFLHVNRKQIRFTNLSLTQV